ncbi:MAG: M23 family metallopeptidase [Vicinamibacteria bacterium]|nr:M23 family metallopeptidase [Vicinamibacteria bacterium]
MANEYYTLIFIPHAKARYRKFQIRTRIAKWLLGLAGASVVALAGGLAYVGYVSWEMRSLRQIEGKYERLVVQSHDYKTQTEVLQGKLSHLENIVRKLGVMAGLEQVLPDGNVGGLGGLTTKETQAPSLDAAILQELDRTAADIEGRSQQLHEYYADRKMMLASTPSVWPVRGYLSSNFGNRIDPFTGQRDFHPGIDVSTPVGTKVVAPADGIVVKCSHAGGYGNVLIINHGYGIITRYGHLDGFNVRVGQRVRRGDVIGFVGNTGRSTAPHLHYEVWVHDQAQNPIHYILDEYRSFG